MHALMEHGEWAPALVETWRLGGELGLPPC